MLKRTLGVLLVVVVVMAPSFAFAAPEVERAEVQSSWLERVWEELRELIAPNGPGDAWERPGKDQPGRRTAADEGGPGIDPEG